MSKFSLSILCIRYCSIICGILVLLILIIIFGIYQRFPIYKSIKTIFIGGNKEIICNTFTITIIVAEPSLPYDYYNSPIRIDLVDKRDDLIVSLLMKPLITFNSIQTISMTTPLKTTT
jgi:hypothetical protein